MRVLVIEDDPDVSDTIISVLTNFFQDVHVEHILDGTQFRRGQWRIGVWNLVILDLMMPGITGFEVCEQLRGFSATSKVPILALTGYDTLQNEEKVKAAGATGYMAKPFEVCKLRDEIQRIAR
jgi:putative two-component system response regulator